MFSNRFRRPVVITRHAAQRMVDRSVSPELMLEIIEQGSTRFADDKRLWAWLEVPGRSDDLLCLALVMEHAVIVKTVMHHWELQS